MKAQGETEESEKLSKMSSLLERLHAKFNQNRPWSETIKLVRQVMEKRVVMSSGGHQHLVSCLETLQKALKVTSLPAMTDRLESIARQNGLGSHLSASGTECYITSDMFYVEVQLDPAGQLCDVKVAHHGENPVSCPELVQQLREKNFDEFSKHLKGLVNLYNLPGDNKLKTKMYLALQSLEQDLSKMAIMYWKATNAAPLDKILHGSVGYLTPRSGGHLMNMKYYASPSDLLDDKTASPIILHEKNVPRSLGMNASVTIEGTSAMYKLPIAPLVMGSHPADNKCFTSANSVDLPACFFLKFPQPIPVSKAFVQKLQNCTGIPLFETPPTYLPLYELITQFELSKDPDPLPLNHNMRFYARCPRTHSVDQADLELRNPSASASQVLGSKACATTARQQALPGQQHCYFLNKDAPLPDGQSLQGTLVSKITFQHPGRVPLILNMIRHQVAYNTLIGSCVKRTILKEDSPGLLQFEVCPLSESRFSVSFQHPVNDSLVCVVMDVQDSTHVSCKLYKGLSDALICTDDFIAKVVQRCMSIPVTMRAIRRKAETIQADTPALSLIAETVEDMVKKNLPPASSPGYGMTTGNNPMSGTTTPTNTFPGGPITTLFNMSMSIKDRHESVGHGEDFSKVSQNPILTSLLQITGNGGSTIGSSPTPPHHTPPPVSSMAGNTKNHPMLMNLLKDSPAQDFSALYGSSPLERQNSSSGSPRMEMCSGSNKTKKKKSSRVPPDKPKHQTEDDFQRELFSMDVDSQNPMFDVSMTADALDTPHITPAPSQCSTPPTTYSQPVSHPQPSIQRMVRLSSSDSIGPDVTDILSDIAEEASKLPSTSDDCPPIGTPVRDSSSSGHSQSALFDSDVFQTNNNENPYTDPADLIADAAGSPSGDSPTNHFFPDGVDFNPDLLNSQSQSGFGEEYFDESSQSGDNDDFKGFASQALNTLGMPMLGGDSGESKFKGSNQADTVDFSILSVAGKALGAADLIDHHSGSQSPLLTTGELGKEKTQKRVKEGSGAGAGSGSGPGSDSRPGKRSRTPSSDGKSKDKPPKRKKADTEGKSPSHSSTNRPFTPPTSVGGSKSPGSSGRSQTPPGVATPPIPKITIQIPKGTVMVGKPSSHSQYTSTGSVSSSGSKSHHSHSSSSSLSSASTSGKMKSSKSEGSSSSKLSGSMYSSQGSSGSSQSKNSSQTGGKPGSSPITKHGLSSGSSSTKMKPQGKPSSLMNPSISKPNISPSHSRPPGGSDKLASPMKPVPGTPPSSKAKSPISSGSSGSHMSGTSSSSGMKSSSGSGSSGSLSQKTPPASNSCPPSSSSFSSSGSSMSSSQNQHGSSKGKSPSRNKKPSLTAVIDKLKHGVVTSGPGGEDPIDSQMGVSTNSSNHPISSKHNMSGGEFQSKREKSDKDKSKVSTGGSVDSSKKTSESKSVGSTGVAKIIISKHDGGSPSIKAKVTLQKPGESGGDGLRPQVASTKSYGSPLISGSTPKHERGSPSHSKSPAYTPQNVDSESESGSSIAERSYQNSPSSDDGIRPLPEYSTEKHKKHKKEKKKVKDKDRDRDRDKDRDKKKSHSIKPENWSKSPISSDQTSSMTNNPMLSADRPSRLSPDFMIGEEDDDLMDVALIGN
ncbi:Mediator of RNA polymerase II transcription subunit 1 [Apodemus speciosus]|uniref:Mediator of RNA polymerase II transcription subunit 1 n=1 Tax=Apodemus speciosus TaxID=105296 RepID=A0ABQ0FBX9_APOSI